MRNVQKDQKDVLYLLGLNCNVADSTVRNVLFGCTWRIG